MCVFGSTTNDKQQCTQGDLNGTPHEEMYRFLTGKLQWQGKFSTKALITVQNCNNNIHQLGIRGDLVDMWLLSNGDAREEAGFTFPAWAPIKRIDFMLLRGDADSVTVNAMRLVGRSQSQQSTASDHLGLVAELHFG